MSNKGMKYKKSKPYKRKYTRTEINEMKDRVLNALEGKELLQLELSRALGFSHSALSWSLKNKAGISYKAVSSLMREGKIIMEQKEGKKRCYYKKVKFGAVRPPEGNSIEENLKNISRIEVAFDIFMGAVKAEAESQCS